MALNSCSSMAYCLPLQAANILFRFFNTSCKLMVLTPPLANTHYFWHMQQQPTGASPLAFGLLFGNEDTKNWSKFWSFVKKVHPCIDSPGVTILKDQDKRSIAAVEKEVKQAAQFFVPSIGVRMLLNPWAVERDLLL
jgi:hypothetical protein